MADRRDYADEGRQPSLFDALAPPEPRPEQAEARIVEFPRRPDVTEEPLDAAATPAVEDENASAVGPLVEDPPASAAGETWLAEIAPEVGEVELTALAPPPAFVEPVPALDDAAAISPLTPEIEIAGETRTPRVAGSPLAGPTLDDVMSRVWEGLATGLPAACPVCHGEVVPFVSGPLGGRCGSCGSTID